MLEPSAERVLATLDDVGVVYDGRGPVLQHFNLEVRSGQRIALVGPSGSGKSTVLHLLAGEMRPHSGRTTINVPARRIATVHQTNPVMMRRSVWDNVRLPTVLDGRGGSSQVATALARVGLLGREKSLARELSGGEVQRLCIARAIAQEAELVIADEPTGQLDEENSDIVIQLLLGVSSDAGVVVATHDLRLASAFTDILKLSHA